MEKNRKEQLYDQLTKAYKSWVKLIDQNPSDDNIEQMLELISTKLAFGTIIVSGRKNPSSYIGTYKQCITLKKLLGGQVGAISNVWYWIGVAQSDDIRKIVKNKQKNLVINVPVTDIEEATLGVGEMASLDIRYGSCLSDRVSYIGNYKVCILLRHKFGGKIGKIHNHWHWIGVASFEDISKIYTDYQSKSKRFKRKRIVLSF